MYSQHLNYSSESSTTHHVQVQTSHTCKEKNRGRKRVYDYANTYLSQLHVERSDGEGSWLDGLGEEETTEIVVVVTLPAMKTN